MVLDMFLYCHMLTLILMSYADLGLFHAQRKVVEIREQLKRIAQRIGIVLKSCESDMQVMWCLLE